MQAQQQAFAIEMPAENGYSTRMLAKTNRDILTDVQTLQGDPQDRATQKKLVKDIGYRLSYSSMQLDHMLRPVRGMFVSAHLRHCKACRASTVVVAAALTNYEGCFRNT